MFLIPLGTITPKLNPNFSFVVWNLEVQFQKDPYCHLNTKYGLVTRKMLVFCPLFALNS